MNLTSRKMVFRFCFCYFTWNTIDEFSISHNYLAELILCFVVILRKTRSYDDCIVKIQLICTSTCQAFKWRQTTFCFNFHNNHQVLTMKIFRVWLTKCFSFFLVHSMSRLKFTWKNQHKHTHTDKRREKNSL